MSCPGWLQELWHRLRVDVALEVRRRERWENDPMPVYLEEEQTHYGVPVTKKKLKSPKFDDVEHVELSETTKVKLEAPAEPQPTMMSAWDILTLERSEHEAKMANMRFIVKKAEDLARKFATELTSIKMEQELREVTQDYQGRANAHDKLAAEMAKRYNFSWDTHSYNPETGEVLESGPEG